MSYILIKNALVVNELKTQKLNVLINNELIEKISENEITPPEFCEVIDASGKYLLPGLVDDQVHFREPGLTHKANIETESKAAIAGGITSFMEMPNTVPNALTQELLEDKYQIGADTSWANYSFFMGASNDNLDEVLKTDPKRVCGVKVFMGSSTGNMLVDAEKTLEGIFKESPTIVATHCEDEATIKANYKKAVANYGGNIPIAAHPIIRNEEACYLSSSKAVELATKFNARLHVLHISTAKEIELFRNDIELQEKRITAEACTHHLWFTDETYASKQGFIKWNPAVKSANDRAAIRNGLLADKIDVLATDHAPHTLEEKTGVYEKTASGGPLVQHALLALLKFTDDGWLSIEKLVEKACHNPAILFEVERRGFIREGYYADLVLVEPNNGEAVTKQNILYKCGWSPFEGEHFNWKVDSTFVNGALAYKNKQFYKRNVKRLSFNRK